MIYYALIVGISLAALAQPSNERRLLATVYAAPIAAYALWGSMLGAVTYYLLAAALSTLCAIFIEKYTKAPDLRRPVAWLCVGSVVLNMFGWVLYEADFAPTTYNLAFVVLYAVAIWVLMGGRGHAGHIEDRRDRFDVRGSTAPRYQYSTRRR